MRSSMDFSDWPGLSALRSTSGRASFGIAREDGGTYQAPQPPESSAVISEEAEANYTVEEAIESLGFGRCEYPVLN